MIRIKVVYYLKDNIRDPEGTEVKKALRRLDFPVDKVSLGRETVIGMNTDDVDTALKTVDEMCQRMLINPILHKYNLSVVQP
jgi:phosphoribosylformylglycinamidine synthase